MHVTKLFMEAIQGIDQKDAGFRDLQEADINLNNVQLEIKQCTWTDFSQHEDRKHCSKVNFLKSENTAAKLNAPIEDKIFIDVTIEKGVVKGLNKPLALPLDAKRPDLIAEFGNEIIIDPSKDKSEPVVHMIKTEAAGKKNVGSEDARADLCQREKEYRGKFNCKVVMKGKGLAGVTEYPIGEAIADVKRAQPDHEDLMDVKVYWQQDENVVEFTMAGELQCKWGFEHTLDMK